LVWWLLFIEHRIVEKIALIFMFVKLIIFSRSFLHSHFNYDCLWAFTFEFNPKHMICMKLWITISLNVINRSIQTHTHVIE
jgi:hypothetical protein